MSHNFHALWVHLVWGTKYRQPLITKELKWPLYNTIKSICKEKDYYLDHINGVEDHVHLLMELKPKFAISNVVKDIKGASWNWVREQQLVDNYFEWQNNFGAISVSPSQLNSVRYYIRNQERHHRTASFDEELKRFQILVDNVSLRG